MGYLIALGPCVGCGRMFSFNPERVPSVRINGEREPLCRDCVEIGNRFRVSQGKEPVPILPGAYDETEVGF